MPEHTAYLSGDSFRKTAQQIREYRKKLEANIQRFCEELAKEGEIVIKSILVEHVFTGQTLDSVEIVSEGSDGTYVAKVQVTSDAIMFLEFGSGLEGALDEHPTGLYGSGTFGQAARQNPEYENWENPEGWVYYGDDGKTYVSHGMQASMPMFRGSQVMRMKLNDVAKRVFGNA